MPDDRCWAAVSLGGIMVVKCAEMGEHVAHRAVLPTETRASGPRPEGVQFPHEIYWYDIGRVHVVPFVTESQPNPA